MLSHVVETKYKPIIIIKISNDYVIKNLGKVFPKFVQLVVL